MTTLSQVAGITRKGVFIVGGLFGLLIVLSLAVELSSAIRNRFFPAPPPPPSGTYGKLPPLTFPQSQDVSDISFSINTISGYLPTFPDRAKVFQFQKPQLTLLSTDNATQLASTLGFTAAPVQKSPTVLDFQQTDPFAADLSIDTDSFNFTLTSNFLTTQGNASLSALPTDQAQSTATNFFTAAGDLPSTIDQSKTQVQGFMYDSNNNLIAADKPEDTQVAVVNFLNEDMDQLSTVYPNNNKTNVHATVATVNGSPTVIEAQNWQFPLMPDQNATYPIKTAQQAFNDLQKGNAYVAQYDGKSTAESITNVQLAYYVPNDTYPYLVPVVVFSNDNFMAYVSAISDSWISSGSASLGSPQ